MLQPWSSASPSTQDQWNQVNYRMNLWNHKPKQSFLLRPVFSSILITMTALHRLFFITRNMSLSCTEWWLLECPTDTDLKFYRLRVGREPGKEPRQLQDIHANSNRHSCSLPASPDRLCPLRSSRGQEGEKGTCFMHDEQSIHHRAASVSEISYRNRHIFFTLSIPLLYGVTQIRWAPFQTAHPLRSLSYTPILNVFVSRFLSILTMTCYSGWALVSTVCFSTCKCQVSPLLNGRYSFFSCNFRALHISC